MSEVASTPEDQNTQKTLDINFGGRVNVFLHEVQETPAKPSVSANVLPEGLQQVNAYGLTVKSHNAQIEPNHFAWITDYSHELIPLYDTNSPEDNPVMYVIDHDQLNDTDEVHRIEVNKINPLTATYEEIKNWRSCGVVLGVPEGLSASKQLSHISSKSVIITI